MNIELLRNPIELKKFLKNPKEFNTYKELEEYENKIFTEVINPLMYTDIKATSPLIDIMDRTYRNRRLELLEKN